MTEVDSAVEQKTKLEEIHRKTHSRYIVFGSGLRGEDEGVVVIDPALRALRTDRVLEIRLGVALTQLTRQQAGEKHGVPSSVREGVREGTVVVGLLLPDEVSARVVGGVDRLRSKEGLSNLPYIKVSRWPGEVAKGRKVGSKERRREWRVHAPSLTDSEVAETVLTALVGRYLVAGERAGDDVTNLVDDNHFYNYAPGLLVVIYGDASKDGERVATDFTFGPDALSMWNKLKDEGVDNGTVVLPDERLLGEAQRSHKCVFGFVGSETGVRLVLSFYGGSSYRGKFDFSEAAGRAGLTD